MSHGPSSEIAVRWPTELVRCGTEDTDMGFVICFIMNGISKVFFGIRMGNCLLSFNKSDPIALVDRLY